MFYYVLVKFSMNMFFEHVPEDYLFLGLEREDFSFINVSYWSLIAFTFTSIAPVCY